MGRRLVFDTETDGLIVPCTRMWIMHIFDLDSREQFTFLEGDTGWMEILDEAEVLIGHNIAAHDMIVLFKLFGYIHKPTTRLNDTMIMSEVLNYKRFGEEGHSLEAWGNHKGDHKLEHSDWTQYSEAMRLRCVQDVLLNVKAYEDLKPEMAALQAKEPQITEYIRAEHYAARWSGLSTLYGWPFDKPAAEQLRGELVVEMQKAYDALSSKLGMKVVPIDKYKGEVLPKSPKWTKQGFYDAHTARWFDVDPLSGYEGQERMVEGDFSRIKIVPLDLDSSDDVKIFLYRNHWVPTEWNYKKDPITKKKTNEKTSPKITEDSLELLGGDGKLYPEFLTAKSRFGVVKTWLENVDENGMLHGDCKMIGTPSMRARHSIIVNVPTADKPWGREMRSLFKSMPGWKLVGCDSAGNQARGLAHYLGDQHYIDVLLNGDIHTYNAEAIEAVLTEMGVPWDTTSEPRIEDLDKAVEEWEDTDADKYEDVNEDSQKYIYDKVVAKNAKKLKRGAAKRIFYAFLFGASGGKLWSYIFGNIDATNGNRLKNGFIKKVPGFKALLDKLGSIHGSTSKFGYGYIPSIAGNRIYVDSTHKLLVYLLQAMEKITCSAALMLTMQRLEAAGIPYRPCIMMHDEIDFLVPEQYAEQAAAIGKQAFVDGPKLFGVEIMDGDAKIGENWYEIH